MTDRLFPCTLQERVSCRYAGNPSRQSPWSCSGVVPLFYNGAALLQRGSNEHPQFSGVSKKGGKPDFRLHYGCFSRKLEVIDLFPQDFKIAGRKNCL